MRPGCVVSDPTPLARTVAQLEALARARHWRVRTPTWDPGLDNLHVLAQAEDGTWRVGYLERGQVDWWDRAFTEQEAVAHVHRALLEASAPRESLEPDGVARVGDPVRRALSELRRRHPELDEQTLEALAWIHAENRT